MAVKLSEILSKYGIRPNTKLDQHFLIDDNYIRQEITSASIKSTDIILEIGPGPGTLTKGMLPLAKKVIVIEYDKGLAELLKCEFKTGLENGRLEIINADALEVDFPRYDKCVSNLPYSISGKITIKLGEQGRLAVLMYQKEFAERLIAKPGTREYSKISVMAQHYFIPEYITTVPKGAYFPVPKVDSAIVRLTPKPKDPSIEDEDTFKKTVSALFMHKNQKARKSFEHSRHMFGLGKEDAKKILDSLPHADERVCTLDMQKLVCISNYIRRTVIG